MPTTAQPAPLAKLLYDRKSAAAMLSISTRSLDYLIANRHIKPRQIGSRVLVPAEELQRFASEDHRDSVLD